VRVVERWVLGVGVVKRRMGGRGRDKRESLSGLQVKFFQGAYKKGRASVVAV